MTIWLGQDGFDYAFQADYATLWKYELTVFVKSASMTRIA